MAVSAALIAVLALAMTVLVVWVYDWRPEEMILGAVVGMLLAGYAAARVVGTWQIRRWEHRHRRRVLIDDDADPSPMLYATP